MTPRNLAVDAGVAGLVFGLSLGVLASGGLGVPDPNARPLDALGIVLLAAYALPLIARRLAPLTVYLATSVASFVLIALGYPVDFPFAPVVALYGLAVAYSADPRRRRRRMALGAALLYVPVAAAVHSHDSSGLREVLPGLAFWSLTFAAAWIAGEHTQLRRELALANDELARLSITDPLTGVANRRRLEDTLRNEWQRTQRTRAPMSVAMVDIDHFKQYNDLHGHQAGDRCLQQVAAQIDRNLRATDLVARYGGEEFAIVMPDTNTAAAREAAERIRVAIADDLAEPLADDQVVTVSIGVATRNNAERQSTDQLLEHADAAVYEAKRTGRNRVRSADA